MGPCIVSEDPGYHQTRFEYDARRETLWRSLYRFFFKRWNSRR
jgi:hypothetical protein